MSSPERVERAVFAKLAMVQPSASAWRRLTTALDAVTDGEELESRLDGVEAACMDWPDALRLAPGRWLRAAFTGRQQARLRVARAMDVLLHDGEFEGDRRAWSTAPALAHLTCVRVLDPRFGDDALAAWLAGSSHRCLRALGLGTGLTDRGARLLGADMRLEGLEELELFRNALGAVGVAAIAGSRVGASLRRLLLGRNPLGEPGARALAGLRAPGLDVLDLDAASLDGAAVASLASGTVLRTVRWLNLANNRIGRKGCAALAACEGLERVEQLFLHACDLDDRDVEPLIEAPWLARLSNLALSGNHLSLETIRRIAARRDLVLEELDVCHNRFAAHEAEGMLAAAPQFAGLRRLCA